MPLRIFSSSFDKTDGLLLAVLMALSAPAAAEEWIYTVRPGDNLWNLTERHLKSIQYVQRLQQLNNVQNPYVILPGTQLRIPIAWTKLLHKAFANVTSVHGTATLQRKDHPNMPVELGMRLLAGDEIRSGNDTFVTVEFADKSYLQMQNNTYLRLENMQIFGDYGLVDTLINLQQGRTESSIPAKSENGTRFRIKTPSAISSVRGTDFRVGTLEVQPTTRNEVLTGIIEIDSEQRKLRVPAGYGAVIAKGMPPAPPVKLLPPPDLSETNNYYQSLPLVIQLKPLPGAQAYRAQIGTDPDFRDLWSEFTTTSLPFRDGNIPDGDYWLRVRGIDKSSIEGKDAIIAFSLNARPEAPFVIAPLPGGATAPEHQEFKWTIQSEASHYAMMVSRDADFSDLIYSNPEVKGNDITLSESLTPGHYFWRIFSVSASEGAGPFSDPMPFRVPYPGPSLEDTKLDENQMTFAWRAAIKNDELQVLFQPIVNAKSQHIARMEALVRWPHPTRGYLSPSEFIPLAEDIGQIEQLGEIVLRTSCVAACKLLQLDYPVNVSVNVNPRQLLNRNFPKMVSQALHDTGLPAKSLILEITEDAVVNDMERVSKVL